MTMEVVLHAVFTVSIGDVTVLRSTLVITADVVFVAKDLMDEDEADGDVTGTGTTCSFEALAPMLTFELFIVSGLPLLFSEDITVMTVVAVAVMDAETGGNQLAYAGLSSDKTIETGDVFRVPAGDLDITLD